LRVSPCARLIFGKGYQILITWLEDEVRVMPSSYDVGAHFEQFIRDQVSGGRYASASEVVRDALRLLERDEQRSHAALEDLRSQVQQGLNSGLGGSAEDVLQRLEQKYAYQVSGPLNR
jgi:antitoxin ParD1/3/4